MNNEFDQTKLMDLTNRAINDIASSSSAILVILGERLGFYKALADSDKPLSSEELAKKTGTVERLVELHNARFRC